LGIVKILESLELKLPYISQVNDPLECLPIFYCPNDKSAIKARYLSILKQRNSPVPPDYEQRLDELYQTGEIQKKLAESSKKCQKDWNEKNCLLSVSKVARNTVMWAHYADKHKGVVIGIDFDGVFSANKGISMDSVNYTEQRHKVKNLTDFNGSPETFLRVILTKSIEWRYEQEYRTVFFNAGLQSLEQQGLAFLKDFNSKKTWFLKLSPESVREVIFGLYTEDSLKLSIKKLLERPELQHVKLYQAEESETYTLNSREI
jgi:hypothetical protein